MAVKENRVYWSVLRLEQMGLQKRRPTLPLQAGRYLSASEVEVLAGKTHVKRAREWLAGRLAAKALLCRIMGLGPQAASFRRISVLSRPDGSPITFLDEISLNDTCLSITHRAGFAAVAVCNGFEVGIDLEVAEPRSEPFKKQFLTCAEQELCTRARTRRQEDMICNAVWCAKEAVLKAYRLGLSVDTRMVECLPVQAAAATCRYRDAAESDWLKVTLALDPETFTPPVAAYWTALDDMVLALAARTPRRFSMEFIDITGSLFKA